MAVSDIPSLTDGNDTLLVIDRVSGSLARGPDTIGTVFGELYDDGEGPHSFTVIPPGAQFQSLLSNDFPRTAPRFELIIPATQSGWMKFWTTSSTNPGLLGAVITFNRNAGTR